MRLVGPDCFGVANASIGLDATLAARHSRPGRAGLAPQSGGVGGGVVLLEHLSRLLYLESFGNPRKFARTARQLGRTMPILAVNAGRSGGAGLHACGTRPFDPARPAPAVLR
jgi:acyl-CoA synthetase (NDP forming)